MGDIVEEISHSDGPTQGDTRQINNMLPDGIQTLDQLVPALQQKILTSSVDQREIEALQTRFDPAMIGPLMEILQFLQQKGKRGGNDVPDLSKDGIDLNGARDLTSLSSARLQNPAGSKKEFDLGDASALLSQSRLGGNGLHVNTSITDKSSNSLSSPNMAIGDMQRYAQSADWSKSRGENNNKQQQKQQEWDGDNQIIQISPRHDQEGGSTHDTSGEHAPLMSIKQEPMPSPPDGRASDEESGSTTAPLHQPHSQPQQLTTEGGGVMVTMSGRNRGLGKANEPKFVCQICGDVAAGFHCGAYVCEACKKFYLRCLKSGGAVAYTCPKKQDCEISRETRSHCQYCRYQKCMQLGMYKPGRDDSRHLRVDFKSIPCKVCAAPSSGFHFGAITCEGCKGFFRRMVKEKLHKKFVCMSGGGCDVASSNRTSCKACRYYKCVSIGMALKGTRLGRQSNSVKRSTLIEYQRRHGMDVALFPKLGEQATDEATAKVEQLLQSKAPEVQLKHEPSDNGCYGNMPPTDMMPPDMLPPGPMSPQSKSRRAQRESTNSRATSRFSSFDSMSDDVIGDFARQDSTLSEGGRDYPRSNGNMDTSVFGGINNAFSSSHVNSGNHGDLSPGKSSTSSAATLTSPKKMDSSRQFSNLLDMSQPQSNNNDLSSQQTANSKNTDNWLNFLSTNDALLNGNSNVANENVNTDTNLTNNMLEFGALDNNGSSRNGEGGTKRKSHESDLSPPSLKIPHRSPDSNPGRSNGPLLSGFDMMSNMPMLGSNLPARNLSGFDSSAMNLISNTEKLDPTSAAALETLQNAGLLTNSYLDAITGGRRWSSSVLESGDTRTGSSSASMRIARNSIDVPPGGGSSSSLSAASPSTQSQSTQENSPRSSSDNVSVTSPLDMHDRAVVGTTLLKHKSKFVEEFRNSKRPVDFGLPEVVTHDPTQRGNASASGDNQVQLGSLSQQHPINASSLTEPPLPISAPNSPITPGVGPFTWRWLHEGGFMAGRVLDAYHELENLGKPRAQLGEESNYVTDKEKAWYAAYESFMHHAKYTLRFVKKIPGFRQLPLEDQVTLVRDAVYPITLLFHSQFYDGNEENPKWFCNTNDERERIWHHFPKFKELKEHIVFSGLLFRKLKVCHDEYAFLCAMMVFSSDNAGVKDTESIRKILDGISNAMHHHLTVTRREPNRMGTLILRLSELKRANYEHTQIALEVQKENPDIDFSQLWNEMFLSKH